MQQQIQQQAGCDALLTKPPFTSTDRSRCCVAGAMDTLHHPLLLNSERKPVVVEEMKTMLFLACPVILTYLLEMLPGIFSVVLVGHIKSPLLEDYIDAAALAVTYTNLTAFSIGLGLTTALDTLCSQAYGAREPLRIGLYMQTGFIVLSIAFVPMFLSTYFCTEILLLLRQPPLVAEFAGRFAKYTLPGILPLFVYEIFKKALQAQNNVNSMLYIAVIGNIFNVALGYVLTFHTSLGYLGAAVSRSISNFSYPLLLAVYLRYSGLLHSFWAGWELSKAWKGVRHFLVLGAPGCLMMCFEFWAFEVLAILAGILPNSVVAIGANTIILNISSFMYMIYLGISVAGSVRVGNAIGAAQPLHFRLAARLSLCLSAVTSLFNTFIIFVLRYYTPRVFTDDPGIIELSASVTLVAASFQFVDAVNSACQGVFRGSGRQILGAKLNFLAFFVVGLPLASVLAFYAHLNLYGIWAGITGGLATSCVFSVYFVLSTDWKRLSDDALQALEAEPEPALA